MFRFYQNKTVFCFCSCKLPRQADSSKVEIFSIGERATGRQRGRDKMQRKFKRIRWVRYNLVRREKRPLSLM
jgi:hypothetical protein